MWICFFKNNHILGLKKKTIIEAEFSRTITVENSSIISLKMHVSELRQDGSACRSMEGVQPATGGMENHGYEAERPEAAWALQVIFLLLRQNERSSMLCETHRIQFHQHTAMASHTVLCVAWGKIMISCSKTVPCSVLPTKLKIHNMVPQWQTGFWNFPHSHCWMVHDGFVLMPR